MLIGLLHQDTAIGQAPVRWEEPSTEGETGVMEKLFLFKNNYIFIILNRGLHPPPGPYNHADHLFISTFFFSLSIRVPSMFEERAAAIQTATDEL